MKRGNWVPDDSGTTRSEREWQPKQNGEAEASPSVRLVVLVRYLLPVRRADTQRALGGAADDAALHEVGQGLHRAALEVALRLRVVGAEEERGRVDLARERRRLGARARAATGEADLGLPADVLEEGHGEVHVVR